MAIKECAECGDSYFSDLRHVHYLPGLMLRRLQAERERRRPAVIVVPSWRHRLLGHPRARLFIHRNHLVTLYPDGRVKITGPGR